MAVYATCPKCAASLKMGPILENVGMPEEKFVPVNRIIDLLAKPTCTNCGVEMLLEEKKSSPKLATILPVYKDVYDLLVNYGFQPCDKEGPVLPGTSVLDRPSLAALTRDNMTVYFYDLPRICIEQNGNQQELRLFVKGEVEYFANFIRENFK